MASAISLFWCSLANVASPSRTGPAHLNCKPLHSNNLGLVFRRTLNLKSLPGKELQTPCAGPAFQDRIHPMSLSCYTLPTRSSVSHVVVPKSRRLSQDPVGHVAEANPVIDTGTIHVTQKQAGSRPSLRHFFTSDLMDDPISARYLWDANEMTEAWYAHNRSSVMRPISRLMFRFVNLVYLAIPLGILIFLAIRPDIPDLTRRNCINLLVIFILLWCWSFFVQKRSFMRWRARRALRSVPQGAQVVTWSINTNELTNHTSVTSTTLMWPVFLKAVETPKGFLLYRSDKFYHWIPTSGFVSETEMVRFAEVARSQVADYRVWSTGHFVGKPAASLIDDF